MCIAPAGEQKEYRNRQVASATAGSGYLPMKTVRVLTDVDPARWNSEVARLNGCPFHTYEWSRYSAARNKAGVCYFQWLDGSGHIAGMGFGLVREKRVPGCSLYKSLSLGSMPAGNPGLLQDMLAALIEYCRQQQFTELEVNSFGTPLGGYVLPALGFSVSRRWEFLVDVDMSEEDLWKSLHGKKRNLIRKGQKENLRVERAASVDQLMEFRGLALETQARKQEQGIAYPVGDRAQYELMKDRLLDCGLGRLYLAYDGDTPVAGAFFAGYGKSAYYVLSSANRTGLGKSAPDLILWTSMRQYREDGCTLFNLGGLSEAELEGQPLESSGLYHFKKRFAAEAMPCCKGSLVLRPLQQRVYNALRKLKAALG